MAGDMKINGWRRKTGYNNDKGVQDKVWQGKLERGKAGYKVKLNVYD